MHIRGNNVVGIILPVIVGIAIRVFAQDSLSYHIVSYREPDGSNDIIMKTIDLDLKQMTDSINIPIHGEIVFKTPIALNINDRHRLLLACTDGMPGKNSRSLSQVITNYALLNRNGLILRVGNLPDIQIMDPADFPMNSHHLLRFLIFGADSTREMAGRMLINSDNILSISQQRRFIYSDSTFPEIAQFRYFKKISQFNNLLYWKSTDEGIHLLKLDIDNRHLLADYILSFRDYYSCVFGLENDTTIYAFVINSNYVSLGDTLWRPSYLKIINANYLTLADSITILMPSLDYGYINNEYGVCDMIGPYIVYYYFVGEGYSQYSPAMLLIFDTRTNEATWLRVGWR